MKEYKNVDFPKTRIATLDVLEIGRKKHHIKALLELDVTVARLAIKKYRAKTKGKLSFTGWLIWTISQTLGEFQSAHGYLKNKKKTIIFNDIDVSITVERIYDGERVPLPCVIRRTNKKNLEAITKEINGAKKQKVSKDDIVLGEKKNKLTTSLYYRLPGLVRRMIWMYILARPVLANKLMGSVMLTTVGMFGKVDAWFIHTSMHPISFGVGPVIKKPRVIDDKIEIREVLNMTVLIDHDVIDGAPMARFIAKLSSNIESGLGLGDK